MNLTELVTDPYNRRARLQPAFLALLPVPLVALVLFPGLESKLVTLVGIAAYLGGTTWLTQFGRGRGKRLERNLFASWDGMPSVSLLRHRDTRLSRITKQRYYDFLAETVPGLTLPSVEQEATDPTAADETFRSVTDWLVTATGVRPEFKLLREENMNYGFRRNFWALRPISFLVDLVLIAIVVGLRTTIPLDYDEATIDLNITSLLGLGIIVVHLLIVFAATKNWVRTSADAYGKQLLAACDNLGSMDNSPQR